MVFASSQHELLEEVDRLGECANRVLPNLRLANVRWIRRQLPFLLFRILDSVSA